MLKLQSYAEMSSKWLLRMFIAFSLFWSIVGLSFIHLYYTSFEFIASLSVQDSL
jgi:hypothetical protein